MLIKRPNVQLAAFSTGGDTGVSPPVAGLVIIPSAAAAGVVFGMCKPCCCFSRKLDNVGPKLLDNLAWQGQNIYQTKGRSQIQPKISSNQARQTGVFVHLESL
jgi:hypothetical protein